MHTLDHTKNIIELSHITYSFDGYPPAIDDVSLNVHQGDFLGLIGPNGSGKTTLLKIILGLYKPSSGTVRLFGTDLGSFRDWRKVGYVAQKATNFDPSFPATVREVVAMGRYAQRGLFRFLTKGDSKIVDKALADVSMQGFANRLIGDLSGGQQQRVFIARALASEPEVILLDEPTVGVDQKTQEEFYSLLRKLNDALALTLVLVSHDISTVAAEATEIAWINKRLISYGLPSEFLKEQKDDDLCGKGVSLLGRHSARRLKHA